MQRKKIQSEQSAHSGDLTEQQQTKIINETRRFLKSLASGGDTARDMKVKVLLCKSEAASAALLFFNAVSHELSSEGYDAKEREVIAHGLSDLCKSFLRLLGPAETFIATAALLRIKELQRWLGHTMVDEVATKINVLSKPAIPGIAKAIERLPLSEQLDVIHQLATISSQAAIQKITHALDSRSVDDIMDSVHRTSTVKECVAAEKALADSNLRMQRIVSVIRDRASAPFVRYACDEARLAIDEQQITLLHTKTNDEIFERGISLGDPSFGRQMERADEERSIEDMRLREQIAVPAQPFRLPSEDRQLLCRIASDAVALYDHAMTPHDIARIDFSQLPVHEGPPIALASLLLQNREIYENTFFHSLSRALMYFFPMYLVDQSPKHLAEIFGSTSTVMKKDGWINYFSLWKALLSETDSPGTDRERITMEIILIEKRLEPKKEIVVREIFESAQRTIDMADTKPATVRFQSFSQTLLDPELNPFVGSDQEHIPLLLQHLHRPGLRKMIEHDLGISFAEISIASQIHLLRFLSTARKDQFERFSRCLQSIGESRVDFLQSFMAVAENPAAAHTILEVAERVHNDPVQRKKIFSVLKTITEAASSAGEYMRSQYKKAGDQDSIRKTVQRLLRKGKDVLDESVVEVGSDIVDSLKNVSSEIMLLTSTFKTLRESSKNIPLSEVESIDVNIFKREALREFVKNGHNWSDMETLYRSRYADPKYTEAFKNKLVESFRAAVERGSTTLYVVRHEGEIIAFCRFDTQPDGSLYFGSFVIDARYDNHKLGMALLEESLLVLGQTHTIRADCDPSSPAAAMYARLGFYVTRHYDFEGVPSTHIVRNPGGTMLQERVPA